MPDGRQDPTTASTVAEALRMKNAFGLNAARQFLQRRQIALSIADLALAERHDRRQLPL